MIPWASASILRSATLGDLAFNTPTTVDGNDCIFLVDPNRSKATRGMRATVDNVPQDDGEIFHRRFSNGCEFALVVEFWGRDTETCASDEVAELMEEALKGWLESMKNEGGRYLWTPGSGVQRMMDEARWLVPVEITLGDGGVWEAAFSIDSPFPYVMKAAQETIALPNGVPTVVANDGNAPFYPVMIAAPPGTTSVTDFTIENQTLGLTLDYDSSRPGGQAIGAGDIAEIDCFRNTIYLGIGGTPGDDDNLKPNIDPLVTDYFTLAPGANTLLATGVDVDVLLNDSYVP